MSCRHSIRGRRSQRRPLAALSTAAGRPGTRMITKLDLGYAASHGALECDQAFLAWLTISVVGDGAQAAWQRLNLECHGGGANLISST